VQQALVVAMVTGAYIPPVRLDLLKNLDMPHINAEFGCTDKDCLELNCKGNRVELVEKEASELVAPWHFDYAITDVRLTIVHGKNDRRAVRENFRISFEIPVGDLQKLWMAHICGGRELLTLEKPIPSGRVLVTDDGNSFNNATFVHYWEKAMRTAKPYGIKYVPPSRMRSVFVEQYTAVHHAEPEMWDGAAVIMGNSVEQWRRTYNPSLKRRLAQRAVANTFVPRGVPDVA
jgi:hypothetical protein